MHGAFVCGTHECYCGDGATKHKAGYKGELQLIFGSIDVQLTFTGQLILLSGGLSNNVYFQQVLQQEFSSQGITIELPALGWRYVHRCIHF